MNNQKYLIPVLMGLLGLTSFCFVVGNALSPEEISTEAISRQPELVETDDVEVAIEPVEQFVAVEVVPIEVQVDQPQDSPEEMVEVEIFDFEVPVDYLVIHDPESDLWDPELDCPEEVVWTEQEHNNPFLALEQQMVFWKEAIDVSFADLNLTECEFEPFPVPTPHAIDSTENLVLSSEDFDSEHDSEIQEFHFEEENAFVLCEELLEFEDLDPMVEDLLLSITEQKFEGEDFTTLAGLNAWESDPLDVLLEKDQVDFADFDLPEDSNVAFADGLEFPADFFEKVEEVVSDEDSFEFVEEVPDPSADFVEVVEEFTAVVEEGFEAVSEEVEAETGLSEVSNAATLLEEEARVADLRRYASDDIHRSNWRRALDELRELVTLRPYHADYHMALGLVHRRLEEEVGDRSHLEEALRKYEEYSEFGGQEAIACLLLAEAHAAKGDREIAFQFLERAASYGMNIARAVQQFPVLEKYTRDTRFVRSALRLERYTLSSVMTRDPFTGPWSLRGDADERIFVGPFSVEQQQKSLAEAREAMAKVEYALRNRDETAAMDAYGIIEEIGSAVSRFDQPELAGELRSILERLDEVEDGIEQIRVTYLYEQARSKMELMKKAFEEHNFSVIDRMHGEVSSIAFSIEELGESYSAASTLVVQAADQLQQRSGIIREFLAKEVHVEGVAISDEGSHAIIGGRWVPEGGEVLEGRLDQILRDRVVFLYKGERITHRFSRF